MSIKIITPPVVDYLKGSFINAQHKTIKTTRICDLVGIFKDEMAFNETDPNTEVYSVELMLTEEKEGELCAGATHLLPGKVGNEFYMTRGHYHAKREYAEYYLGSRGEGLLILQNEDGTCTAEKMFAGSVHYIPPFTAHRMVNTGTDVLSALAFWSTVAGHDYTSLAEKGFKYRVFAENQNWLLEKQYD